MDALALSFAFLPNLDIGLKFHQKTSCAFQLRRQRAKNLQTQSQCNKAQMPPGVCSNCNVFPRRAGEFGLRADSSTRGLQGGVLQVGLWH